MFKNGGQWGGKEEAVGCGQARNLTSFNPRAGEVLAKYHQGYLQEENASCYFSKNYWEIVHPIWTTTEVPVPYVDGRTSWGLCIQQFRFQNPHFSRTGLCQEATFLVDTSHDPYPTCNSLGVKESFPTCPEQRCAELVFLALNHQICKLSPRYTER